MKTPQLLGISSLLLAASACAGIEQRQPLATVAFVDLHRYSGTWHEIARLPMWFQRHCVDSMAIYTSRPDGTVGVHNECKTDTGGLDQVDGVATVVDQKTNARLTVVFDNFFARLFGASREGNYWIVDIDQEYRVAMVGTPDRRHLWILSRTAHLEKARYEALTAKAADLGFPIKDLIRTTQFSPP